MRCVFDDLAQIAKVIKERKDLRDDQIFWGSGRQATQGGVERLMRKHMRAVPTTVYYFRR